MTAENDSPPAAEGGLKLCLISLHGLIRAQDPELGRDVDTGGQIKYVLELARALAENPRVAQVELLTRQIISSKVGSEYAQLEETIAPKAKLIRIPFGPRRYLYKEKLWPHVDTFVDQALAHFRRSGGLPDLIHGHYADAGYCGAQLARLLGVPFAFTGHSLGRVKRERLSKRDGSADGLEETYHFIDRIEAEEFALETASLVVASTMQEVEEQYAIYEHYVPERMEVIPPGVDLDSFRPPAPEFAPPQVLERLLPFLRNPEKPMILCMARPDERKNLEMMIRVYGESPALQKAANLVMVLGSRDDLQDLAAAQRRVILNVLSAIDKYDLYGLVAYPKTHNGDEVPDFYRLATQSRGVFVNPALTEPFGLTLLEAAGSGLPIVTTNDGGPRDIIANCQNGVLIDPFDPKSIEHALLRALTEPKQWDEWSTNGIAGATEHYSWKRHADRYIRDVNEIVQAAGAPPLDLNPARQRTNRRLPDFDRLIITDIDNTLTGNRKALEAFRDLLKSADSQVGFGIATGRPLKNARKAIEDLDLPTPDVMITSVGTRIFYGESLTLDRSWQRHIAFQWDPEKIREVLRKEPGFKLQKPEHQGTFKISYEIDTPVALNPGRIRRILREQGVRAKVVFSLGQFLDVIPIRAGDGLSIRHLALTWGFNPEQLLVAGDSGNDEEMLKGRTLGVVVGNYSPELEKLRNYPRIYFAEGTHAQGIVEGIHYYNFLGHITIPNDRSDGNDQD